MKYLKSHIGQCATALLFVLLLLFPIGIQAAHGFEIHEHETCQDFSNHIHQQPLDCSICDFHFSTFQFDPKNLPVHVSAFDFHQPESRLRFYEPNSYLTHFYLRGPPSLLFYT